jgi:hypothetical protein
LKKLILFILMLMITALIFAQDDANFLQDAIKIYIDCDDCDMNFIREEIQFVNYVRDRNVADVHIIFTDQNTGGGGEEYSVEFIGLGRFVNVDSELTFVKEKAESKDEFRAKTVKTLRLGLVRYASETPIGEDISISYNKSQTDKIVEIDPWKNWVYSVSGSGWFNGVESSNSYNLYGNISAKKTTKELKMYFRLNGSYNKNRFKYDELIYESSSKSRSFYCSYIKSINDHWSYGSWIDLFQSDYSNISLGVMFSPGIEYNIFPYSESNKKQIRFQYKLRSGYSDYQAETVYERIYDTTVQQSIIIETEFVKKWGSLSADFNATDYIMINDSFLGDLEKNKISFDGEASINLFEGLSLNLWGSISRIHNQISLPAGDVSTEELLLKQRELETQYSYWASIGLSYSFGSIYNNIVNPRFSG